MNYLLRVGESSRPLIRVRVGNSPETEIFLIKSYLLDFFDSGLIQKTRDHKTLSVFFFLSLKEENETSIV